MCETINLNVFDDDDRCNECFKIIITLSFSRLPVLLICTYDYVVTGEIRILNNFLGTNPEIIMHTFIREVVMHGSTVGK